MKKSLTTILMLALIMLIGACNREVKEEVKEVAAPLTVLPAEALSLADVNLVDANRTFVRRILFEHGTNILQDGFVAYSVTLQKGDTITYTSFNKNVITGVLNKNVEGLKIGNTTYLRDGKKVSSKVNQKGEPLSVFAFNEIQSKETIVSLNVMEPLTIMEIDWNYLFDTPAHFKNDFDGKFARVIGVAFGITYKGITYLVGYDGKLWRTHEEVAADANKPKLLASEGYPILIINATSRTIIVDVTSV